MSPVELGRAGYFIIHFPLVASLIPPSFWKKQMGSHNNAEVPFHRAPLLSLSVLCLCVPVLREERGGRQMASHASSSADLCWVETWWRSWEGQFCINKLFINLSASLRLQYNVLHMYKKVIYYRHRFYFNNLVFSRSEAQNVCHY